MGGENFNATGRFFYCAFNNKLLKSRSDILEWFKDAKTITLENEEEFKIIMIDPMMAQFTDKAVFLVKVDTADIPTGIYPTTAIIH